MNDTAERHFTRELLAFLAASPTPFHAVQNLAAILVAQGFEELLETAHWNCRADGRYFLRRNGSSLIAFNNKSV